MSQELVIQLKDVVSTVTLTADTLVTRDRLLARATGITQCTNQPQFDEAVEAQTTASKFLKAVEKQRLDFTRPLDAAKKTIVAAVEREMGALEIQKDRLQKLTGQYAEDQRRAAEAERRRIEEQQRAEIEAALARQEADRKKAEEEFGDDAADFMIDQGEPIQVTEVLPTIMAPKAYAGSIRSRVVFEVVDAAAVPRAFLMVDERTINQYIRDHGEALAHDVAECDAFQPVPGIKFRIETKVQSR